MKTPTTSALSLIVTGLLACLAQTSNATVLSSENFNGFTAPPGNFNGGQFESGLAVAFSGSVPNWSGTGGGVVHAVDIANVHPVIDDPRDFAVMIWQDNVITMNLGIPGSNVSGSPYDVAFSGSPAVYQAPSQQTSISDGLLIEVLRADNSVLASHTHLPGAWAGTINLAPGGFSYIGDGTGDVRLRVGPSAFNSGRFGGAIDNLTLTQVPEPSALLLVLGGLGLFGWRRRA
ncbi:MAG: PEP-CTERM sorting domain-containing protein [Verrucomicrobiales bacterium]